MIHHVNILSTCWCIKGRSIKVLALHRNATKTTTWHQPVIQFHLLPFKSLRTSGKSLYRLIRGHQYLTWTSRVMGPLLSTSKISPFLVPTRMWPWPKDMARMEGLSSKSNPVECMNYSLRTLAWARIWADNILNGFAIKESKDCGGHLRTEWRFLPLEPGARTALLMA